MRNFRIRSACPGGAVGLSALAFILIVAATERTPAEDAVQFLDPLNDEPLEIPRKDITSAVAQFHETGENPYAGDEQVIAEGQKLYARWCQACHLPDGTGRIGPSLVDARWKYERTGTDIGKFEIIYAGGAGAMQAFGQRLSQDEILQLIAFLDSLQAAHESQ
jgi:cytochrome c-L